GKIKVTSDSDNVIVPFSFIKSTTLVITFDLPPVIFYLVDRAEGKIELKNFSLEGNSKFIIPISEGNSLDLMAIMEKDTLNFINSYLIDHKVDNPTGLTYVLVSHEEASINMIGDTLYDIHNNKVTFDSTTYADIVSQLVVSNESNTFQMKLETGWILAPNLNNSRRIQLFFTPLDTAFFIKKAFSVSRGLDNFVLKRSNFGLQSQQDVIISTGSDNLFGYEVTTSYDDPYLPLPSHWRKSIPVDLNTMRVYQGKYGYELESVRLDFPSFYFNQEPSSPKSIFYFNKPSKRDAENNEYLHSSISIGASYVHLHGIFDSYNDTDPSTLQTPEFTINEEGEAIFEQMQVTPLPAGSPMAAELSSAYLYETVKSGDTIRIEQNARVNFPDYMTYLSSESMFMKCNNDWLNWEQANFYIDDYGGIKQTNGINECRDNFNSHWRLPLFTTQVFAHNRTQTNLRPFKPLNNPVLTNELSPYYEFSNMSNNKGTLQVLSDAYPYTILNQAGQCTADFEYQIPSESLGTTYFPSFNLLQVSVDGRAVDVIQPDQNGKIRLIIFDPDSSVTSTEISLMLASGDEINLPISYIGENEYDALIPGYIPKGFVDVVARIQDTDGNKCELTASPGFYFGNTSDNIKLDARLRMTSYALNNVENINMEAGDTLNYKLLYANYGSDIARNVVVTFPTTPYFTPIGSPSWTIDSLNVNDTVQVPINLLFLGKQQSTDEYTHYSPSITWTSGGTTYLRKHNVLIDFQNTITGIIQTANTIPNRFELYQNYPNPFNPSTTIKYDLPKQSRVKIEVYDILGRKVATLVDETKIAGSYQVIWNANRSASGVYFYRIETGNYCATKKLLLLK
ncbi:T9SS type A sorting domain-containing protein, partial [bacterium BMS3Abin03]|nr:T9SS type A sorting domain-containing protein [bacterium BMS3Abin03]